MAEFGPLGYHSAQIGDNLSFLLGEIHVAQLLSWHLMCLRQVPKFRKMLRSKRMCSRVMGKRRLLPYQYGTQHRLEHGKAWQQRQSHCPDRCFCPGCPPHGPQAGEDRNIIWSVHVTQSPVLQAMLLPWNQPWPSSLICKICGYNGRMGAHPNSYVEILTPIGGR